MRVIEITKHGSPAEAFNITERPEPEVGPHDVLIKTKAFGVNFADVLARLGLYPDAPPLPAVLGYEVSGHIEKVGSKVTHLQKGDHVTGMTRFGGYAEYDAIPGLIYWVHIHQQARQEYPLI